MLTRRVENIIFQNNFGTYSIFKIKKKGFRLVFASNSYLKSLADFDIEPKKQLRYSINQLFKQKKILYISKTALLKSIERVISRVEKDILEDESINNYKRWDFLIQKDQNSKIKIINEPILDEDNKVIYILHKIVLEELNQKEYENKYELLRDKSRELFEIKESFFTNASEPKLTIQKDGKIIESNSAFNEIFNRNGFDKKSLNFFQLWDKSYHQFIKKSIESTISNSPEKIKLVYSGQKSEPMIFNITLLPAKTGQGMGKYHINFENISHAVLLENKITHKSILLESTNLLLNLIEQSQDDLELLEKGMVFIINALGADGIKIFHRTGSSLIPSFEFPLNNQQINMSAWNQLVVWNNTDDKNEEMAKFKLQVIHIDNPKKKDFKQIMQQAKLKTAIICPVVKSRTETALVVIGFKDKKGDYKIEELNHASTLIGMLLHAMNHEELIEEKSIFEF